MKNLKTFSEFINEGFEPDLSYNVHKLTNSRMKIKSQDEIDELLSNYKHSAVSKILQKAEDVYHQLEQKYNDEQERHNRWKVMDSLKSDMIHLRAYIKYITNAIK